MLELDPHLQRIAGAITEDSWRARVTAAEADALRCREVNALCERGMARKEAVAHLFPDLSAASASRRLRRYERFGVAGLIDRRLPKLRERVVNDRVLTLIQGMLASQPELRSPDLRRLLGDMGIDVGESTIREHLRALGRGQPVGRPPGTRAEREAEPLPLAGAELLKAVEAELGAVRQLSEAVGAHLEELPEAEGLDDTAHRDEKGRFLPEYNAPKPRMDAELGDRYETVERRRSEKNLREMRLATSSFEARYRKDLALTLLPLAVGGPRWSELRHWRGAHLETLVGFAYQPATLDKHAREMKLSGATEVARETVAEFWSKHGGAFEDPQTGAVVVYGDASTKPVWTRHFTRSAKVAKLGGRVMPAMSTFFLHSGSGTPLVYRTFSGSVSVPKETVDLLEAYERAAGDGTARRLLVLDREAHAVWLFKVLAERGWHFVIPLRNSVTGPNARFEELGEWTPYLDTQDMVQDGFIWLNDSRSGQAALRIRVVGRKRHRTGKVAWYATNTDAEDFSANDVIRLYFDRWPNQEHVFRDANGKVGLGRRHGYGKKKIQNVAIIDRLEKLAAQQQRAEAARVEAESDRARAEAAVKEWAEAITEIEASQRVFADELNSGVADSGEIRDRLHHLQVLHRWLVEALREQAAEERRRTELDAAIGRLSERIQRLAEQRASLQRQTEIFTVDTELDELMTGYKLTFINLCGYLMREYLDHRMELDTLIASVLTLPGERVRTATTETIRLYRHERDAQAMNAVERACRLLNAKALVRGDRTLRFELVEAA